MKLLRFTQHAASESQQAEIGKIWGASIEVHQISRTLPESPKKAVEVFDQLAAGYDVVEVFLPINLLHAVLNFSEFSKQGKQIVRAAMSREQIDGKVIFHFLHYEEIKEVNIVTERL